MYFLKTKTLFHQDIKSNKKWDSASNRGGAGLDEGTYVPYLPKDNDSFSWNHLWHLRLPKNMQFRVMKCISCLQKSEQRGIILINWFHRKKLKCRNKASFLRMKTKWLPITYLCQNDLRLSFRWTLFLIGRIFCRLLLKGRKGRRKKRRPIAAELRSTITPVSFFMLLANKQKRAIVVGEGE